MVQASKYSFLEFEIIFLLSIRIKFSNSKVKIQILCKVFNLWKKFVGLTLRILTMQNLLS